MGRKKKTTKGKQKIEMKKLVSEDARHVCFSKRKAGLFSKASELATLCGAEVAILVDSPAGTPYTFGSPAMNPIVDRFMSRDLNLPALNSGEAQRLSVVQELNNQCMEMSNQLDAAKKKKAMLEDRLKALVEANQQVRRVEDIEELNLTELKQMEQSLHELKGRLHLTICKNLSEGASSSNSVNPVTMLNLSTPRSNQAGPSVNPFTMMNLPALGATQMGSSGSKVNLFSMANLFERRETQLGQTLNPIMMQNASTVVRSSKPSVVQPGPNDNTVGNLNKTELNLLGRHVDPDTGENPNELKAKPS